MSNQSQEMPLSSDDSFTPTSFIILCIDDDGSVAFEASWGNSMEDVKKFASLVSSLTNGEFNKMISDQLKLQSKDIADGKRKFNAFNKIYNDSKVPSNLVIDPTEVELN
jgi:hypothetical protein